MKPLKWKALCEESNVLPDSSRNEFSISLKTPFAS